MDVQVTVSTVLLGALAFVGLIPTVVYLPGMLAMRAYEELATILFVLAGDMVLALRTRLPHSLRAGWVIANFLLGGTLALLWGGDRGAIVALYLAAILSAVLLLGWRVTGAVFVTITALIAFMAWEYHTGQGPPGGHLLINYDLNSPAGWAGLWSIFALVSIVLGAGLGLMLHTLRRSTREQLALSERSRAALKALLREQERQAVLQDQVAEAERSRNRTERALADALVALRGGFWETDLATGQTTWSEGMYALLGYNAGEVVPSTDAWRLRTHPDDYEKVMKLQLTEQDTVEYRVMLPGGETRHLRSAMSAVYGDDGTIRRLRGLVTDVTEDHEKATRLSRLAEIANRTANAVVITNTGVEVEWVNEAFTRLTGWSLQDIKGQNPGHILQGPHTDPAARKQFRQAIEAGAPFAVELLNYARDGRPYWVQIECYPTRDASGRPNGYIAVESDVTTRRTSERRDLLEQRLAAILLEAEEMRSAARQISDLLVEELDIRLAQVWMVEPGNPRLVWLEGAAAEICGAPGADFLEISRTLPFAAGEQTIPGVGVPGAAWGRRASVHLPVVDALGPDGQLSRRLSVARAAGITRLFATPILGQSGVVGVLEIGGTTHYPGHELLPILVERVAGQLGAFMARLESRRAFEALFAGSPDALLLANGEGTVVGTNTRANRLFGEVVGRPLESILQGAEEALQDRLRTAASATAQGTDGELRTVEARGAEGTFWAEVSIAVPNPNSPLGIVSVRDLTDRHRMEETITRSLKEKELLLREIHHRVKNNLQIISSLLSLQARGTSGDSARAALEQSVYRVRSMSLVHQLLYGNDHLDRIDIGEFTRRLASSLQHSLVPNSTIRISAAHVDVPVDIAVPCGLVINELLTNSFKHGRSADGECTIELTLVPEADGFVLSLSDNGPGLPVDAENSETLGRKLVQSLIQQLQATSTVEPGPGARLRLYVPLNVQEERPLPR